MDVEFVRIDGVRLELRRWAGAGDPILLLHEGLGSLAMWRDFPEKLAAQTGRSVIAWSRQGHGQSDRLPASRNPDYMHIEAARVPALMDELQIERAHLFGHSDGGSIALIVAATTPARVASLVLEAPHVMVEDLTYDSIAKVKDVYAATDLGKKLARYHADPDHTFWMWNDIWLDPRFRAWVIEDLLPSVRAPALLIQGVDDEYGTMAQLDRIAAVLPQVTTIALERCGHSPHRDRPAEVLAATENFFRHVDAYENQT